MRRCTSADEYVLGSLRHPTVNGESGAVWLESITRAGGNPVFVEAELPNG